MMNDETPGQADKLVKSVARAAGISDAELDRIVSNPFLLGRVRAGIRAEQDKRAALGNGWLSLLMVSTRAIAILLFVTIAAVAMFWGSKGSATGNGLDDSDQVKRIIAGGTCALSNSAECSISKEEVLAMIFAEEGGNK